MKLEHRILTLLRRSGPPMSAMEIDGVLRLFWGSAALYPSLDKLEKNGLIVSKLEPLKPGRKYQRRLYAAAAHQ